jgi:hypothetical protein
METGGAGQSCAMCRMNCGCEGVDRCGNSRSLGALDELPEEVILRIVHVDIQTQRAPPVPSATIYART